jgi:hypothetical protein
MNGQVLLLAYKRPSELEIVLNSIRRADLSGISSLLILQQSGNEEVSKLLGTLDWMQHTIRKVEKNPLFSIKQQINSNLFSGIKLAFLDPKIDFVSVLEDDIVVAPDFFKFSATMCHEFKKDLKFRGVNGFSGVPAINASDEEYCQFRYGLGWGWTVTREIWLELQKFWTGIEDNHWDGLVDPFIRTGFVVMPIRSRIQNIGFEETATHTRRENPTQLNPQEKKLLDSFTSAISLEVKYRYSLRNLNWRHDCHPYLPLTSTRGRILEFLYVLNWKLSKSTQQGLAKIKISAALYKIINLMSGGFK